MNVPVFDQNEMEVKEVLKDFLGQEMRTYSYPATMREAVQALLKKKPYWMLNGMYQTLFSPKLNPDNIARGQVFEAEMIDMKDFGGKDMFGIEWEYIEQVGGSMVRPGKPFITDANEIKEKVEWPDPDKWDWEGSAKANNGTYLKPENCNVIWFLNGWYERLISFMDFENAIMALYDEDQQDAVHAFFDKLTDLYIKIFEKYITFYPDVDGFCIHDDWGSQKETFFSPALAEEMIVPYMRRLTDFIHSKGKFCELHSCGQNIKQVPNYIKAGWDIWQGQPMNDMKKIYELYGDKIIVGANPEQFPLDASEEIQRQAARDFVDTYMQPGKSAILSYNDRSRWTVTFMEELYSYSRKKACGII